MIQLIMDDILGAFLLNVALVLSVIFNCLQPSNFIQFAVKWCICHSYNLPNTKCNPAFLPLAMLELTLLNLEDRL